MNIRTRGQMNTLIHRQKLFIINCKGCWGETKKTELTLNVKNFLITDPKMYILCLHKYPLKQLSKKPCNKNFFKCRGLCFLTVTLWQIRWLHSSLCNVIFQFTETHKMNSIAWVQGSRWRKDTLGERSSHQVSFYYYHDIIWSLGGNVCV